MLPPTLPFCEISVMQTLMRAIKPPEKKPKDKAKETSSAIRPPKVGADEIGSHKHMHETPENKADKKRTLKRPTRSDKAAGKIRPMSPPMFIMARMYMDMWSLGDPAPSAWARTNSTM